MNCICGHPADSHFENAGRCNGRSYDTEYHRAWNCLCASFNDGSEDDKDTVEKLPILQVPAVKWTDDDAEFDSDIKYLRQLEAAIVDEILESRLRR